MVIFTSRVSVAFSNTEEHANGSRQLILLGLALDCGNLLHLLPHHPLSFPSIHGRHPQCGFTGERHGNP